MMTICSPPLSAVSAHSVRGTILLWMATATPRSGNPISATRSKRFAAAVSFGFPLMITSIVNFMKNPIARRSSFVCGITCNRGYMKAGSIPLPHRVFSGLYRRLLAMAMVGQAGFCYIASRKKRLVPIPFGSIICIRFNGYNLSLLQKRWRWAPPLESIVRVSDGKYTPLFLFFRHFLHETATLSAFFVLTLSRDRRASLPAGPVSVRIFKKRFR